MEALYSADLAQTATERGESADGRAAHHSEKDKEAVGPVWAPAFVPNTVIAFTCAKTAKP